MNFTPEKKLNAAWNKTEQQKIYQCSLNYQVAWKKYLNSNYKEYLKNLVVVSPDMGGAARARYFARKLNAELALMNKERNYSIHGHI